MVGQNRRAEELLGAFVHERPMRLGSVPRGDDGASEGLPVIHFHDDFIGDLVGLSSASHGDLRRIKRQGPDRAVSDDLNG
jgi:hypothetical protein